MPTSSASPTAADREGALGYADAFIAGFRSPDTRRAYRRDLECWLTFCLDQDVHPYAGVRCTDVESYMRQLEQHHPPLANGTLRRRISTLSSWFTWLEDEDLSVGNPAARVRRPRRHTRPQPWLDRNELTDLLTAGEAEGGAGYALVCLLALNGLRISEPAAPTSPTSPAPATSRRCHLVSAVPSPVCARHAASSRHRLVAMLGIV